jgi:hypothetical protein
MNLLPDPLCGLPLGGALTTVMSGIVTQSGAAVAEFAAGLPSHFADPGSMVARFSRRNPGGIFNLPVPRNRSTSIHSAHQGELKWIVEIY